MFSSYIDVFLFYHYYKMQKITLNIITYNYTKINLVTATKQYKVVVYVTRI